MEGIEPELLSCPLCRAEGDTLLRGVCYPNGSVDKKGAVMCPACGCRATLKAWQSHPRSYPEIVDIVSYIKSSNIYETEPKFQRWVSTLESIRAPAQAVKEPTASELIARFKSRPGISWEMTVRDIERAISALSSTNCGGTE